jgi:flagellar basal body-associated protein FliL
MMMMMAAPVKPKSLKPKMGEDEGGASAPAESKAPKSSGGGGGGGANLLPTLILAVVMLVASVAGPAITLYVLGPVVLPSIIKPMLPEAAADGEGEAGAEGEGGGGHKTAPRMGLNLPLEEFTVNLKKDPQLKGNQYLRTKMNLSVLVPEAEDCNAPAAHGEGGHAAAPAAEGGGHGAPAPAADPAKACNEAFQKKMERFTPTLRDVINTALMKRSALQLGSLEGQETLKDEVSQEMNSLLSNEGYQVQRINLEEFIIQR